MEDLATHGIHPSKDEGGCYAKVIRSSQEDEPLISQPANQVESDMENAVFDFARMIPVWDDDTRTENTRASYPLDHLPNVVDGSRTGHPKNIVFLSQDAFGVLPPIARLDREQAMYYFPSGYTAKVGGTERGVKKPRATFSPCSGAPFLPLPPPLYARMLGEQLDAHAPHVSMVNTGWTGGGHGTVGRIRVRDSRAILRAALRGDLDRGDFEPYPVFRMEVPGEFPGVPSDILFPRRTWEDPAAYDRRASELTRMLQENFGDVCQRCGIDADVIFPGKETDS